MFEFEWDPAKAAGNLRKHQISFKVAATVFKDPRMLPIPDKEHGEFEERWITMGHDRDGHLLVVSHTWNEAAGGKMSVRIISARRATRNEQHQYELGQ